MELEAGDSGIPILGERAGLPWLCAPSTPSAARTRREQWLPGMARGELIGCFGLTEPVPGPTVGNGTTARRDGDDWLLNGAKMWITSSNVADVAVVEHVPGTA